jgi:hypothetical protein
VLPQRSPLVDELASHLASDAKRLVEDAETGSQVYRYIRTGTDHFSLAFTYDCITWSGEPVGGGCLSICGWLSDWQVKNADPESTIGILNQVF